MSDKITRLKEKFRLALTSTAKVISDDFEVINKTSEEKKKDLNSIEINDLTNPSDFIKLRAETDSELPSRRAGARGERQRGLVLVEYVRANGTAKPRRERLGRRSRG